MSLLLTLNISHTLSNVSIINFEHVNADWEYKHLLIKPYLMLSFPKPLSPPFGKFSKLPITHFSKKQGAGAGASAHY